MTKKTYGRVMDIATKSMTLGAMAAVIAGAFQLFAMI